MCRALLRQQAMYMLSMSHMNPCAPPFTFGFWRMLSPLTAPAGRM